MLKAYLKSNDVIQALPHDLISNNKYFVRFARNEEEIEDAQRLRFNVFNLELGEGLQSSYEYQKDIDAYDKQCHHLMVIERSTDKVIGTYRMQTWQMAQSEKGFYSGEEYDISCLPIDVLQSSVEVGRACIAKDHRNGRVLYLLWRGLAKYMEHTSTRYLFGCCSLTSQDEIEAWVVMEYLRKENKLHPQFHVEVTKGYKCARRNVQSDTWKQVKLPQLFRLYMDIGAKVCSPPAIDRQFKTIDYLVILDIESLDERTKMLFFS